MAIFVPGMPCAISGRPITRVEDVVAFPPFVANEADPLHVFSDAVIHREIFLNDPGANDAQARYEEFRERTAPARRICAACGERITDPDDYIGFGHLVSDPGHPLFPYNYAHLHRSCVPRWDRTERVLELLERLQRSGEWRGSALARLIDSLRLSR